ncbi:uncharacterized protein LKV04_018485 [Tautogolabrus adspersus]
MSAKRSWAPAGDEGPEQTESADPGRSAQRRFRSSAFPSSLSWDSDSEKETLDEEELQHFSNPHGLAAHSPGSPSSGLRLDSEEDQEPEKWPLTHSESDSPAPVEGHNNTNNNNESTKTDEPNTSQRCQTELSDSTVWNVSEGAELFLSKVKPKEGCQTDEEEADNGEDEKRPKGTETKEPERDVYSFPGDSDPESPPPAPWAHCTFIQRCRKKRVLLRPFSGLGTLKHTSPVSGRRARSSPQKLKPADSAQPDGGGGVYDFEDFEAVDKPIKFRDRGEEEGKEEEDSGGVQSTEIFTCVECSIYFKKQKHLQEHIVEHCQSEEDGGRGSGKNGRFQCVECGWNLSNRLELADHNRRHQESRLKILEEIEKLNENGTAREIQNFSIKAMRHLSSDSDITQDAGAASIPGKMSDPEIVTSPPLSPLYTSGADPTALLSDATPPNSARAPAQARRRFICTKCNFSTRTPQALANHTKTHNRKKPVPKAAPPVVMYSVLWSLYLSDLKSNSDEGTPENRSSRTDQGAAGGRNRPTLKREVSDSEDCTITDIAAAPPASQVVFRCVRNRRFSRRGKTWTSLVKFHPRVRDEDDDDELPGSDGEEEEEAEKDGDESKEIDAESSQQEENSPVEVKPHNRAQSNTEKILYLRA